MTDDRGDSAASTDPRQKTTRLPITRMNCPWAARRVAEYLQRVDGVVETHLESRSDTVVATYDPTLTSEAALTAAVESPGSVGDTKSTRTRSRHRSGGCGCRSGGCRW